MYDFMFNLFNGSESTYVFVCVFPVWLRWRAIHIRDLPMSPCH